MLTGDKIVVEGVVVITAKTFNLALVHFVDLEQHSGTLVPLKSDGIGFDVYPSARSGYLKCVGG